MKIFISLPFTGKEDTLGTRYEEAKETIYKVFGDSTEIVAQENIEEIIKSGKSAVGNDYTSDLIKDLQLIATCDAIFLGDDWTESKGCRLEKMFAQTIDKKIYKIG